MKAKVVAAMLGVAVIAAAMPPARAGSLGDAVIAAGAWVGDVEAAMSTWLDRLWNRVAQSGGDRRAAEAFRRLAIEAPDSLDALAGRAGYALAGYAVSRGGRQGLVLRFRYDRDLTPDERLALSRELALPDATGVRPELTLLEILVDATDWRDSGAGGRYAMSGVEVQVQDTVSSTLIFSEPRSTP